LVVGNRPVSLSLVRRLWPAPGEGLVVCADGGINQLFTLHDPGLVPQYLTGDLDSADRAAVDHYTSLGTVVRQDINQNENDLHKAITLGATALRPDAALKVDVVGATGGRFDHQFAVLNEAVRAAKSGHSVTIHSEEDTLAVLAPGAHTLSLRGATGRLCGLAPLCGPARVVTTGLKWDVNGVLDMAKGISSSNRVQAETVQITTTDFLAWTCER
jgi:thiamine pyrophosphokinase